MGGFPAIGIGFRIVYPRELEKYLGEYAEQVTKKELVRGEIDFDDHGRLCINTGARYSIIKHGDLLSLDLRRKSPFGPIDLCYFLDDSD